MCDIIWIRNACLQSNPPSWSFYFKFFWKVLEKNKSNKNDACFTFNCDKTSFSSSVASKTSSFLSASAIVKEKFRYYVFFFSNYYFYIGWKCFLSKPRAISFPQWLGQHSTYSFASGILSRQQWINYFNFSKLTVGK